MKGSYEKTISHHSLKELDEDIRWSQERREMIKSKVLSEIDHLNQGKGQKHIFLFASYGVLAMILVLLSANYIIDGELPFFNMEKQAEMNGNGSHVMSKEERLAWDLNLYEWKEVDGKQQLAFTEEGFENLVIPLDAHEKIPGIIGEPDLIAYQYPGDRPITMQAFYLLENNETLYVHNTENDADLTVDYFLEAYGTTEVTVANKRAVLSDENSNAALQLYIPTDTYIWYIYGGTKEQMLALANLFDFGEGVQ